jgi:hypothetical protein
MTHGRSTTVVERPNAATLAPEHAFAWNEAGSRVAVVATRTTKPDKQTATVNSNTHLRANSAANARAGVKRSRSRISHVGSWTRGVWVLVEREVSPHRRALGEFLRAVGVVVERETGA